MINQSLTPNEGLRKENIRYSRSSVPSIERHVRYSRHLSFQHNRIPSNGRCRLVIHTTIRSPTNNRRSKGSKSIDSDHDLHSISTILAARYRQDKAHNAVRISNSTDEITQSSIRSLGINKGSRRHQSISKSIANSSNSNDVIRSFQEPNVGEVSKRQHLPFYSNREKKDLWSNTKDFHEDSRKTKKKRKKYPCGCPCSCSSLLASLLAALLLCIAITAALVAILIKPQTITTTTTTTTIQSTTSVTTTTASATLTTTTISTTVTTSTSATTTSTTLSTTVTSTTTSTITTYTSTTTSTTATTSTTVTTTSTTSTVTSATETTTTVTTTTVSTSSTTTTLTTTSCNTPNSTIFFFNRAPTTYTQETYTYTASSAGTAVLEFGFASTGNNQVGYLDDVSIVDTNASNSEMLVNGDFENGTLVGWQQLCTSNCQSLSGSLSTTSCHTGSFCYADGCKNGLDFLRQTFTPTIGHVYTLNFWLDVSNNQDVYVRIL